MAGYQNLYLNQAETFDTDINLSDSNNLPYNLTNFTVQSSAKKSYYSNSVIINFNATITDANNGIINLSANNTVTSNVQPGILIYDVLISDNSGTVTRVLEGQVYVSPGVTGVSYSY